MIISECIIDTQNCGIVMANQNELFEKLFDSSPKKESLNNDLFNFNLQLKPIDPADKDKKHKKKKDEDVHEYIRLAEQSNDKTQKSVKKWKDEQTMSQQEIRQKKQFQKIAHQFQKTKKAVAQTSSSQKKQYLPNIINPFEKPEKKVDKPRPQVSTSTATPLPKKEAQKPKIKVEEEKSKKVTKVEMKDNKIIQKEKQKEKGKEKVKRQEKRQQKPKDPRSEKAEVKKLSKPNKLKKESSSSSSSSYSSESEEQSDWRSQLRQITKYNPNDMKFKIRDKQVLIQSGVDRIFGQDKVSLRMGMLEQEQDLRRQLEMKQKKKHRH